MRWLMALGAVQGLTGVIAAAAAAHLAAGRLTPAGMRAVDAAVQLQLVHALAVIACALWLSRGGWLAGWAGGAFLAGSVLFCGAAWINGVTGASLGPTAPTGGLLLMLGWLLLAIAAVRGA